MKDCRLVEAVLADLIERGGGIRDVVSFRLSADFDTIIAAP